MGETCMSTFEPDLMLLLHDVARLIRVAADKRARVHDMTRAQWIMLLWLERQPGISQKELAEKLEVEPITVARLVDRLEQRGMVERRADPKDRRVWRLHLRPEAHPLISEINAERAELNAMISADLPPDTVALLKDTLTGMRAMLCQEVRGRRRAEAA